MSDKKNNPLENIWPQSLAASQMMQDQLANLAALYPDCDVQIVNQDEIVLVAKNDNPTLKDIGERIHAAAEGRINAIAASEDRELQRWKSWAAGWRPGIQGLLDMAQNKRAYDFYVAPVRRIVKTKKGPRRFRVQMVYPAGAKQHYFREKYQK